MLPFAPPPPKKNNTREGYKLLTCENFPTLTEKEMYNSPYSQPSLFLKHTVCEFYDCRTLFDEMTIFWIRKKKKIQFFFPRCCFSFFFKPKFFLASWNITKKMFFDLKNRIFQKVDSSIFFDFFFFFEFKILSFRQKEFYHHKIHRQCILESKLKICRRNCHKNQHLLNNFFRQIRHHLLVVFDHVYDVWYNGTVVKNLSKQRFVEQNVNVWFFLPSYSIDVFTVSSVFL